MALRCRRGPLADDEWISGRDLPFQAVEVPNQFRSFELLRPNAACWGSLLVARSEAPVNVDVLHRAGTIVGTYGRRFYRTRQASSILTTAVATLSDHEIAERSLPSPDVWPAAPSSVTGLLPLRTVRMIKIALAMTVLAVGSAAAADEPTSVVATTYYRTFSHAHPVLKRIKPGEVVATKTIDSAGLDEKDVKRSEPFNPLTGPFFVEGAEPGDALVVRLKKVRLNRDWGWSAYRLGLFSLTPEVVEHVYPNDVHPDLVIKGRSTLVPWDIDRKANTVRLRTPKSQVHHAGVPRASRCSAASAWRRRAISRRPRGRRGPTAATSITTRSARGRPSTCRSITPAACCSSATATPSRPTASRRARGSRRRWTWSSSSS